MLFLLFTACATTEPDLAEDVRKLEGEIAALRERVEVLESTNETLTEIVELFKSFDIDKYLAGPLPAAELMPADPDVLDHEERCVPPELLASLADRETIANAGRALPHTGPEGSIDGLRMSALRRGGLIDGLGLRNGDIIQRVDGVEVASIAAATEVYDSLVAGKPEQVTIGLLRRGSPHELVLRFGECSDPAGR